MSKLPYILIAEDDESEYFLFKKACSRCGLNFDLHRVAHGEQARTHLEQNICNLPQMIVSDVKMRPVSGLELLEFVRSNPLTSHIPFVLFSASGGPQDREQALKLGVSLYVVKPSTLHELVEVVRQLQLLMVSSFQPAALAPSVG